MAVVFGSRVNPPIVQLILEFFRESTVILDEAVPLTRRAAVAIKWAWALSAIGCRVKTSISPAEMTPSRLYEVAEQLLRCAAQKLYALSK